MTARALACLRMLRTAGATGISSREFAGLHLPRYREHLDELVLEHGCEIESEAIDGVTTLYRLAYEPEGLDEEEAPDAAPPVTRPGGYADPEAA